ncbi:HAMP domain-containing protein [Paenibacillus rhizovicinus]|uniref:histidine kinase n=1 Tax=Paenibacillus rhizovicinus TaxID=2704463 RepID=A0A6C0P3V9_9BACL|nr:HAMP domain-containing sensor histidine kinase [Paenibacillus rhizovicinus]QHW32956.1 HAMP domain-containing protein [Paenibacillus rhizovicinus]
MTGAAASKRGTDGSRFLPRSLSGQLLARSLLILAGLLVLIGFMQSWLMKDSLYQSKADSLRSQLMTVPMGWFVDDGNADGMSGDQHSHQGNAAANPGSLGGNGNGGEGRRPDRNAPFLFAPGTSLAYVGTDGSFTDLSGAYSVPSPQVAQAKYTEITNRLVADRGRTKKADYSLLKDSRGVQQIVIYRLAGPPDKPNGLLQMGAETSQLTDVMTRQLLIFASLSVLALTAGLALYMPALRRTLVPLSRMVEAVKGIDAGNLKQRLPELQGQQEIDRLSVGFNGMLERLEASFRAEQETTEAMRRFIADASHELRTPLTSIHGFLEVLLRGAAASNPEQLQTALRSMHGESKRINKLVEDLLTLARLDRAPQLKLAELSLDGLVRGMEPQLRMLAVDRSVTFQLTAGIRVQAEGDKLKQVLLNLFQNAVQHTEPGSGAITVSLMADSGSGGNNGGSGGSNGGSSGSGSRRAFAELAVSDNGIGIADDHLPRLFERFYRSDASRARKYGGSGLGLAITQSIVESHGGSITARSKLGEGSMFIVRLPI